VDVGPPRVGIQRSEDTNAFGRHSAVPWVMTDASATPGRIYAVLATLSGTDVSDDVRVEISGGRVAAARPGGTSGEISPPARPPAQSRSSSS
jgi:hypothetical protein